MMSTQLTSPWRRLKRALTALHRRLLPDEPSIGWSPYLWLLYTGFLVPGVINQPWLSWPMILTLASLPPFLWLYFRGFWRRGRPLLWNLLGVAALGALLTPFNQGATVYFIFAGAPAAMISTPLTALAVLTGLAAVLVIESVIMGYHITAWIIPAFILMLVGVANIFYCELARKNARLRLTQDEVSHLAAVAERERIARDLHDLLGHSLSLIAIKAELAGRLLEVDSARAAREINEVETVSRDALREVRKAVSGYRQSGFDGELEHARMTLKAAGIKLDDQVPADLQMGVAQESVLAMALRESITNIVRHAHAHQCRVRLEMDADTIELEVSDDGRGGAITPGNGLSGMRERVRQLGGELQIDSSQGVTVLIAVPRESNIQPLSAAHHAA
ncbi:MAG: sensor histidine kinase [Wenzhouxiangellaceae bacterium]